MPKFVSCVDEPWDLRHVHELIEFINESIIIKFLKFSSDKNKFNFIQEIVK